MQAYGFKQNLKLTDDRSIFAFEAPKPVATGHDLLVKITAISVNPVDVEVRQSQKNVLKQPKVIGWDATGMVVAVGAAVTAFGVGATVFYAGAFERPGCDSDFQLVDERLVGHAPKTLSLAAAAAMPLTSLTAWESLFEQLGIDPAAKVANAQKSILIINGAGGVGSVATQLAHWAGLQVIATASRPASIAWVKAHGATAVVDYHQDIVAQVQALGWQTVDYILELQDLNRYWATIVKLIKPLGAVVSTTGSAQPIPLMALKSKQVRFAWEWMYTKSFYQTPTMSSQQAILNRVSALLDQGELQSTLTRTLTPISAATLRQAHELVASHHMIGKVVISN